jgi:hypothetical protein
VARTSSFEVYDGPMAMTTEDTLLAFSEWLDGENITPGDPSDGRTHQELAQEFIAQWTGELLAGQSPPLCQACAGTGLGPDGSTLCSACQRGTDHHPDRQAAGA